MASQIQIMEKPEWVSWEDIKQCLYEAHSINRAKGINMTHYQWPVEKIREYLGPNGVVLVALDGDKVVGTVAIREGYGKSWYAKGKYAYMCFAGVLPQYNGMGIYGKLVQLRENIAKDLKYNVWIFDTHRKNTKIQKIALLNGYRLVGYFRVMSDGHCNVVMAKWPNGCPYSKLYCRCRFILSWIRVRLWTIL